MSQYAADTSVTPDRSRAEIERTLERYGATGFMYGWNGERAMLAFEMKGRRVQFAVPLPPKASFRITPTGRKRTESAAQTAYEQATRQRWRALALVIKAKLEAVESGITTFEDEFLAHILLPNGGTVGDWMKPQIEQVYLTGTMPPLLPAPA
jgi:hypothetical protein